MKPRVFRVSPYFEKLTETFVRTAGATIRPGTVRSYRSSLRDFLGYISKTYPDVKRLSDLRRSPHVEGWLADMASDNLKPGTRRGRITCVCRFLCLVEAWGWDDIAEPEIVSSRDMPRLDKYLPRPMTPEIAKRLDRILRRDKSLMSRALLLLRRTGMRVGELRDLQLNCMEKLNNDHYILHVPIGKLHAERVIPIDAEAASVVKHLLAMCAKYPPLPDAQKRSGQFLLVRENWRRPSYAGISAALRRLAKKGGIDTHITLHQLRHTYATELLRCGISLPALMKLLGHRDITMTLRYAEVSQAGLQEAYHTAAEKNREFYASLDPGEMPQNRIVTPEYPDLILNSIDGALAGLRSAHRDAREASRKKKIQRILERLSRVVRDFDILRKE